MYILVLIALQKCTETKIMLLYEDKIPEFSSESCKQIFKDLGLKLIKVAKL